MNCNYACQSADHAIARRSFLGSLGGGAVIGGLGAFSTRAAGKELASQQKRVVLFNMYGGLSQLESWDPKPGTDTGGPFLAIPTSVPGLHISELLPHTAQIMNHLCVVRGVSTGEADHNRGTELMMTGRPVTAGLSYPHLGAVVAKAIAPAESPLPGHLVISPFGGGARTADSAYLGPQFSSITLGNGKPPAHLSRLKSISEQTDVARHEFRRRANERFLSRRRTAMTEAYTASYEQALRLMQQADTFDVSKEPDADAERYGKHDLGRHCLLARRLLEKGVTFVQVFHTNFDTHNDNFNFHYEQMGDFDRPFAMLVKDLADRGMLDSTLIVVMSEFGRTPNINATYGRDHWAGSWSVVLGGAKIPRGMEFGKTNAQGTEVVEGKVDAAELFHTYLSAIGLESTSSFVIDGREIPMADPAAKPIKELLV